MFPSPVMFLKLSICNFVLTSARNLTLLRQPTYMHLKVLITLFQKMIRFIKVWATVHEIFAVIISNPDISKAISQSIIV